MKTKTLEQIAHTYSEIRSNNEREYSILFRSYIDGYNRNKKEIDNLERKIKKSKKEIINSNKVKIITKKGVFSSELNTLENSLYDAYSKAQKQIKLF